ncbi:hypothetical protein DXG03_001187 [Asterophora parasitica]|uniref:F-box domain-containing protein n=1 Tax=Asterophora parasitica TaxID=117018 RepID=A0A9P7K8H2_9AGAR|nr:hypothetical protein DXG03_001187 [Asterophora parasitica]
MPSLYVHDVARNGTDVDLVTTLLPILPNLVNLNNLCFIAWNSHPKVLLNLLHVASSLPCLSSLELRNVRFDGAPFQDILPRFNHLSSLVIMVGDTRQSNINYDKEAKETAEIIRTLAPKLVRFEVPGDLVTSDMLAAANWGQLRMLRFVNHAGNSIQLPPMPCLHTLEYHFSACNDLEVPSYLTSSYIYDALSPAILSTITSLTLSNACSGDGIILRLPESLEVLRVIALRDLDLASSFMAPAGSQWTQYHPLNEIDAFQWINAAGKLPRLAQLTLTLQNAPSPAVLNAIAFACPMLRRLEIEQGGFEANTSYSPHKLVTRRAIYNFQLVSIS